MIFIFHNTYYFIFDMQLMRKMSIYSPPKMLVENYMVEIAKSFNVEFTPDPMAMLVSSKIENRLPVFLEHKSH